MAEKAAPAAAPSGLWSVYDDALKGAKYIDLTHTLTLPSRVERLRPATFGPPSTRDGEPYQYDPHGFEATRYELSTDQYGTQLDPQPTGRRNIPPLTSCRRPSPSDHCVISIADKVARTQLPLAGPGHSGLGGDARPDTGRVGGDGAVRLA